jgi:putative SOS response-associated peptidase YedK
MCGRVIRTSPVELLKQRLDLASMPDVLPDRYNLAPADLIPVLRYPRQLELLRWGLKMPEARMAGINARVESLAKPIYREKLRNKRCLVLVDGFYEWRSVNGKKQPYLIAREDKAPMVMAGLYDSSDGCAIITMPSQGIVATLHDRMPDMLAANSFGRPFAKYGVSVVNVGSRTLSQYAPIILNEQRVQDVPARGRARRREALR